MAGYSSTPLAKKLGIKKGFKVLLINQPDYYFDLFTDWSADIEIVKDNDSRKDLIHFFVKEKKFLQEIIRFKKQLQPNGMLWISWPKKTSKIISDLSEDIIRDFALENGLVDIKVCAVDETWSGLKLVIPLKDR